MNKTKIDNQTIAHILLDLRQKHHLSQEQLAQTLGCARSGSLPFSIRKPYFAVVSISASL